MIEICLTLKEKMDCITNLMNNKEKILVYGSGDNGKTRIFKTLSNSGSSILRGYNLIHIDYRDIGEIVNYLSIGIPCYMKSNKEPTNDELNFFDANNVKVIEFVGKWDPILNDYV